MTVYYPHPQDEETPSKSTTLQTLKFKLYTSRDTFRNPAAVQEVLDWLESFELLLASKPPIEKIASHFCQLSLGNKKTCDCDPRDLADVGPLYWLHFHHDLYNKVVHELIVAYEVLEALRELYLKDIRDPDPDPAHPGFGRYVRKDYGRYVVTFLEPNPSPLHWFAGGNLLV